MPRRVRVYDSRTGNQLPTTVPESHLRVFPYLRETPSESAGKPRPKRPRKTTKSRRRAAKPATKATPEPTATVADPPTENDTSATPAVNEED